MKIYNYDKETFEYVGTEIADESPLEPGTFLIPANSTTIKVPAYDPKYIICKWHEDLQSWTVLPRQREKITLRKILIMILAFVNKKTYQALMFLDR